MSTFHSTIDALLSWKEMNVAVFDPAPTHDFFSHPQNSKSSFDPAKSG
jgi:hypothetical protein